MLHDQVEGNLNHSSVDVEMRQIQEERSNEREDDVTSVGHHSASVMPEPPNGWRRDVKDPSLPEHYARIAVANQNASFRKKIGSFSGIGFLIAVCYMDPGNWATDVAGGASFGYDLLFIILISSLTAMFLQFLSLKLGIAAQRDLAQACRDSFHPKVVFLLWIIMEIAIIATDMAELLGAAIALYLMTSLPLPAGVAVTCIDVFFILIFQSRNLRILEVIVAVLTFVIFILLLFLTIKSNPNWGQVFRGLVPTGSIFTNPNELFVAIGVIGATVMPHSLFLHSALVQSRGYERTLEGKKFAKFYGALDSNISLTFAFFVNSFLLILSAAAFHATEPNTSDLMQAYKLLSPLIGTQGANVLFGIALLASGEQASLVGTIAGQVIMEGLIDFKIVPWKRRLLTRAIALIPCLIITIIMGSQSVQLLILSQVILSITLPFAIIPLVMITSNKTKMGADFVNSRFTTTVGCLIAVIITGLNLYILTSADTWNLS